jgi:hypothetical protein
MAWNPNLHPRAGKGHGSVSGRFVKKLLSARTGESVRNDHGVKITSGVHRQGNRRRKLFSVEGGSVHRSAEAAAAEAQELGAPVVVGERTGPKTHTGWLGRYRRMTIEQLEDEQAFLDQHAHNPELVDPATLHVRTKALASALAEARGEKAKKERPGARKNGTGPDGKDGATPLPKGTSPEVEKLAGEARKALDAAFKSDSGRAAQRERLAKKVRDLDAKWRESNYRDNGMGSQVAAASRELTDFDRFGGTDHKKITKAGEAVTKLAEQLRYERRAKLYDRQIKYNELTTELNQLRLKRSGFVYGSAEYDAVDREVRIVDARIAAFRDEKPSGSYRSVREVEDDLTKHRNELYPLQEEIMQLRREGEIVLDRNNKATGTSYGKAQYRKKEALEQRGRKLHRELALAKKREQDFRAAEGGGRPTFDDVQAALKLVRPGFGDGKLTVQAASTGKATRDLFDIASQALPKEWVDRINDREVIDYDKRLPARRKGLKLRVKSYARAHYENAPHVILMDTDSLSYSTALHEAAHAVEAVLGNSLQRDQADFFKYRTNKGTGLKYELRKLSKICPGSGYKSDEQAIEDEFVRPYMGKVYGGVHFELLSMGLEGVFFNANGMWDKDPEMRNWILGLLGGKS